MSEYAFALDDTHYIFRLRTGKGEAESVRFYYADRAVMTPKLQFAPLPMEKFRTDRYFDWYEIRLETRFERIAYYFELQNGVETLFYYGDCYEMAGTPTRADYFQLPFNHRADRFAAPAWTRDAVVYNIFPDSFAAGKRLAPNGAPPCRGGTVRGVTENLDYIASLGFNCIYLNPIFAARSYHRYDTLDYYRIDPHMGAEDDLRDLVRRAHALGAELPHERRRERHVNRRIALDGLNGLEDLALVRDRAERAADHALAAGGALGVVDVGAAEPVGMDAVHAAGLAAWALKTHDGVELALLEAAPAADALIGVDVRLAVLPRDGLPRADRHARMLQTALAHVRDLHDVVGAFVAGEFDDIDERLFVVDLRIKRFFHTVGQQRKLRKLAQRQSHSQPQPFADDGTLEKQTVPVCTDLTGDDLERQLFEPLGIIAALVGETCDLREYFVTDTYLSGFNAAHIALLLIEKLVWIREFSTST